MTIRAHSSVGAIHNILISLLLLGLVVSLFFIPEIISMYRTFSGNSANKKAATTAAANEAVNNLVKKIKRTDGETNLDKIFDLVSSGYLENPTGETEAKASLNPQALDSKAIQTLGEKSISWEAISSPPVRNAFREAQKNAAAILREMPEKYQQTRFALLSFVNGTGWIQRAEKSSTSADRALTYIEQLDMEVTTAMIRESVDRSDFLSWSRISLGPLLSSSRAVRMKMKLEIPFNPRVTLAAVELRRPPRTQYGKFLSNGRSIPTMIRVAGYVVGKDTSKLMLIRNGKRATRVSLRGRPDEEGKRAFRFSANKGDGLFLLRAIDTQGNIVDTYYSFFPRADAFPRRKNNSVILPIQSVSDPKDFVVAEVDPRLDRFFRVASSAPNQTSSNAQFDRF